MTAHSQPERRTGAKDRRNNGSDRRNEDRVLEDVLPRRNPYEPDRRKSQADAELY